MPQSYDTPVTITTLMPWFIGAGTAIIGVTIGLFRWIFLTNVVEEIKELKAAVKALTLQVSVQSTQIAVLTNELQNSAKTIDSMENDRKATR